MCRNIKTLHNFAPPATEAEIRASAIQFVRKLSGFTKPSKTNEAVFNRAVERVTEAAQELLDALVTNAPPRDRDVEAAKARARAAERFPTPAVSAGDKLPIPSPPLGRIFLLSSNSSTCTPATRSSLK